MEDTAFFSERAPVLELAIKMQEHVERRIREMLTTTLAEVRKLEYVRDSEAQRSFMSGKIAAYEEMLRLVQEIK